MKKYITFSDGTPIITNSTIGFAAQWLEQETEHITDEREFFDLILKLYNEGPTEEQLESVKRRKAINKYLVPPDWGFQIDLVLDQIITNHILKLEELGYTPIKVQQGSWFKGINKGGSFQKF